MGVRERGRGPNRKGEGWGWLRGPGFGRLVKGPRVLSGSQTKEDREGAAAARGVGGRGVESVVVCGAERAGARAAALSAAESVAMAWMGRDGERGGVRAVIGQREMAKRQNLGRRDATTWW